MTKRWLVALALIVVQVWSCFSSLLTAGTEEIKRDCQNLLAAHDPHLHVFRDLSERVVCTGNSTVVRPTSYCVAHGQECLAVPEHVDMIGIPCVDWSPAGLRVGYDGKTMQLVHAFIAIHLQSETPLVIVEEVPDLSKRAMTDYQKRRFITVSSK